MEKKGYMIGNKAKCNIDWRILEDTPIIAQKTMDLEVQSLILLDTSITQEPCHSGKVVIQSNKFMYLGQSFEAIQEEHEIDLIDYDEMTSHVDAHLWQGTMEVEIESMYSNNVQALLKAHKGDKTHKVQVVL